MVASLMRKQAGDIEKLACLNPKFFPTDVEHPATAQDDCYLSVFMEVAID